MYTSSILTRRVSVALLSGMFSMVLVSSPVDAQEDNGGSDPSAEVEASVEAAGPRDESEPVDPFALPEEADAEELFAFIRRVKMMRGRDLKSVMRAAKAATGAAEIIRGLDGVTAEDELNALREQIGALSFLQQYDPASRQSLQDLFAALKEDSRPEFRKIGEIEGFKSKIASARIASEEEQLQLIAEFNEMFGEGEFDRDAYGIADSLARSISYSDTAHVAATLYEDMAARMSESSDETLQQRAPKMLGAARRIRLPGNKMEIVATTTEGEPFDWESYRGKVVLVDFWASWCAPCRAEIPNMKRSLELYGEKGFAIVGVNLDRTPEDCAKYVADEELTWTNLMSDNEDERGWDNPLATYYGITGIPTAILVDQEGKVVSLKARGPELDRLLVELLGEVESEADDSNETADVGTGDSDDQDK